MKPQTSHALEALRTDLNTLIDQLPEIKHGKLIQQSLEVLLQMARSETERLDWKTVHYALQDMTRGFELFYSYRHTRKITIFGSARTPSDRAEYLMAQAFARAVTQRGFMVMTGGGGGIMQAGNQGAGAGNSFGLNIQLPFEQEANPFIEGDPRLLNFRYFFTRKLFLLRESDAIVAFPGGYGTQDEVFECLTLIQTGKSGPVPIVLMDRANGDYWQTWDEYIEAHLLKGGLLSPEDRSFYTITDNLEVACAAISQFYRVYHSSRYVDDQLIMRLKCNLSDGAIDQLNQEFQDMLSHGNIERTSVLSAEIGDETENLPRLALHFNQRDFGRLYQFIHAINDLGEASPEVEHPEQK